MQEKRDGGYDYSLASDSTDRILASVACNISGYRLLVTMRRLPFEETAGEWQVASYQMVGEDSAKERMEEMEAKGGRVEDPTADHMVIHDVSCVSSALLPYLIRIIQSAEG